MTVDNKIPRLTSVPAPCSNERIATTVAVVSKVCGVSIVEQSLRQSGSPGPSALRSAYCRETAMAEAVDAHHLDITRVSCQIETDHNHEIGEHQNASFEVVALALTIHIAEQEHTENDSHHVPLREDEVEGVIQKFFRIDIAAADSAEKDKGGNLEEANLESISRTDLHGKRNIAVHGERDGVLCTRCQLQSLLSRGEHTKNSVVLGTSANRVMPKNFSSMSTLSNTTSTVLTKISAMIA